MRSVRNVVVYSLLLTGTQETQEQASSSSQKEVLSTVTNRFQLQEVCHEYHSSV